VLKTTNGNLITRTAPFALSTQERFLNRGYWGRERGRKCKFCFAPKLLIISDLHQLMNLVILM